MARRRRGRKGRGKPSIPVLPVVAVAVPLMKAYSLTGPTKGLPKQILYEYTGFIDTMPWQSQVAIKSGGMIVGAVIAHKIANKMGINKYVRKATMGWLSL